MTATCRYALHGPDIPGVRHDRYGHINISTRYRYIHTGNIVTISYMVNYWYQGTWYQVLNTPGTNRSACKAVVATGTWYQVPGNLYRSFFPVAWCSQVPTGGERTSST